MERDELEYEEREIIVSNQYALHLEVDGLRVELPVGDTVAGIVAYLPRDEDFRMKQTIRGIVRYETGYLPVLTPEAYVASEDDEVVSVELES